MSQIDSKRERRINMRVSEQQERILRAAAELSGETLTGFVLSVATERAADVVARAQRIDVTAEAFDRFIAALDGPPEEMPTVRRYAGRRRPALACRGARGQPSD
ncbi:MAG: DUF1778 domain-containing protein [Solirubrobacteraceae bacterium]